MVADIKVDKVADMEVNMVADKRWTLRQQIVLCFPKKDTLSIELAKAYISEWLYSNLQLRDREHVCSNCDFVRKLCCICCT